MNIIGWIALVLIVVMGLYAIARDIYDGRSK